MSAASSVPDYDRQQLQTTAQAMRQQVQQYTHDPQNPAALGILQQAAQKFVVHSKRVPDPAAARVAEALGALSHDLQQRPGDRTASVARTLAQAVDLLGERVAQPTASPRDPLEGLRGLAVDDDELALRTARAALEKAGFAVTAETSGETALERAGKNPFHFVLTDIMMPGMSGLELCAALRKLPAYKKTPVIFVTSAADFANRAQAVLSGGNELIAKPFLFSELVLKTLILTVRAAAAK